MLRGSVQRLPLWVYGAIAAMLGIIATAAWERIDVLSRAELLIPAMFWATAFIFIALRRGSARS